MMLSRMIQKNLVWYLRNALGVTIPIRDAQSNEEVELPVIAVVLSGDESSIEGFDFGHRTVRLEVQIITQGYDDRDMAEIDEIVADVASALGSANFHSEMNPMTNDQRPEKKCKINRAFINFNGIETVGKSNLATFEIEAFAATFNNP